MHVLPLPLRHAWSMTALAALLALALTAILLAAANDLGDGSPTATSPPRDAAPQTLAAPPAQHARVPLAPPTVFAEPLRAPAIAR